jgi:phosphate transport system protein
MENHVLKRFDEELNKLRYRLVRMGTLVQHQIELAIKALLENNTEHAKLVLEIEQKVNKLDIKIDKQCLRIFALHQPVAMDLRLVLSTVSINDNMELIGDLAVNIAKNIIVFNCPPGLLYKTKLGEMGHSVVQISSKLIDSYVNVNIGETLEVIKIDTEIGHLFQENFNLLINLMKSDSLLIEPCSYLLDISRNLQTMSRQMLSVAEELVLLFEAKMIKHQNLDNFENIEEETNFDSDENSLE